MSMAPLQVSGNDARWGVALGKGMKMGDSLWDGLTDAHAGCPMGITAENLASKYNISRQECDDYAIRRCVILHCVWLCVLFIFFLAIRKALVRFGFVPTAKIQYY